MANKDDDPSPSNLKLFAVSEATEKLLNDTFSKVVLNAMRKQWQERYGDPKCVKTRIPKLDTIMKDRLSPETSSFLVLHALI